MTEQPFILLKSDLLLFNIEILQHSQSECSFLMIEKKTLVKVKAQIESLISCSTIADPEIFTSIYGNFHMTLCRFELLHVDRLSHLTSD